MTTSRLELVQDILHEATTNPVTREWCTELLATAIGHNAVGFIPREGGVLPMVGDPGDASSGYYEWKLRSLENPKLLKPENVCFMDDASPEIIVLTEASDQARLRFDKKGQPNFELVDVDIMGRATFLQ